MNIYDILIHEYLWWNNHFYATQICTLHKEPVSVEILQKHQFAAWKYLFVTWNIRNALIWIN